MPDRREALKIIGAIGSTCAFPFASDELYGQHVHPPPGAQVAPQPPAFFNPAEFRALSRLTDLIVPPTETPGAVAAGVPNYIDSVVTRNAMHQSVFRTGLAWLEEESRDKYGEEFIALTEEKQIALLQPLSNAIDAGVVKTAGEKFFRALKSMTADGYYTSRIGMVDELGFKGGSVLAEYKACEIPEH